jgi:large subunit ribosomal protein L15
MKLHTLRPAKGATHKDKRLGRGDGSGHGGTSTKGTKGHQSRSGFKNKMAHEGGQMPIQRRIPKRGFNNVLRVEFKVFNIGQVEQLAEKYGFKEVSKETLYANKLVGQNDRIKILGTGEIKGKFAFKVNAVSGKAKAAIEAAGGSVEIVK